MYIRPLQNAIAVIGNAHIIYTGEELRQIDETVWLQLIHLARKYPVGSVVEFTPYGFCKAIGWAIGGKSYARLRECLTRMQATSLTVYSKRLKEGISLSMIPVFRWKDHATGKALIRYQVTIAPELVEFFIKKYCTEINWEQRLALPEGIATWLYGYYASHRVPYDIKLKTIAMGAGLVTDRPAKLREMIQRALNELERVGFLKKGCSKIVGDLVHVKRA